MAVEKAVEDTINSDVTSTFLDFVWLVYSGDDANGKDAVHFRRD